MYRKLQRGLVRYAPENEQGQTTDGEDVFAKLQAMIARKDGDAGAVALVLFQENYQLREANRQLKAKAPAEGALVLVGDDPAAWDAYRKLGAPSDLQTAIAQRDQAQGDLAKLTKAAVLREVAEAAGYRASVLAGLDAQAGGLAYEMREQVGADGAKAKVAYVKPQAGDAVPLAQYAEQQWGDFMPALVATPAQTGTAYPPQQQGANKPPQTPRDAANQYLARAYRHAGAPVNKE